MAIEYSQGLRDFLQLNSSMKRALANGVFEIFTGAAPASPNDAATGTKLVTVSLASGAVTSEVLSNGTVTLSGANGQVSGITVNSVEIMSGIVLWDTDLTTTAANVAADINSNLSSPEYTATSSGAVITIKALPGTGSTPNTYVVATTVSGGTLAASDVNLASGVNPTNGLPYGAVTTGKLVKSGIWSGVNGNSGTAGYFRLKGSVADADGSSTVLIRIQGTCGTSGADYNMSSTSLTSGATHTVDTFELTLNENA